MSAPTASAAWTASPWAAPTASAPTRTIAIAAAVVTSTFWTARAGACWRRFAFDAIEVRFIVGVEISAAFDHCCRFAVTDRRRSRRFRYTTFRIRRRSPAHLGALLFQDRLARQLDAIAFDGQHFHQYLVAFFQFVLDIFNSVLSNFADVQQTITAGDDFYERPELRQPRDFPEVGLSYFRTRGQIADNLQRLISRRFIVRSYVDLAGIFHIDLDTGLLDDAADHLAARPNHVANLIDRNLQGVNTWSIRRNLDA